MKSVPWKLRKIDFCSQERRYFPTVRRRDGKRWIANGCGENRVHYRSPRLTSQPLTLGKTINSADAFSPIITEPDNDTTSQPKWKIYGDKQWRGIVLRNDHWYCVRLSFMVCQTGFRGCISDHAPIGCISSYHYPCIRLSQRTRIHRSRRSRKENRTAPGRGGLEYSSNETILLERNTPLCHREILCLIFTRMIC